MPLPTQKTFTVKMVIDKETKGAVRYTEVDDDDGRPMEAFAKVGTQYIRKTAFERGAIPRALTLTVSYE